MEYQIRDIAELLNISKQMVRYYEQNGVITPKRMEGNNYRVYDIMDYFALGEAISLSRNAEVDEALLEKTAPDAIVLATGSKPLMPPIEGIDGANVVTAEVVLYGNKPVLPGPTIVCGGAEVGAETAEFIAQTSFFPVTILEMKPAILSDMRSANMPVLMGLLAKSRVQIITNAKVTAIGEQSVSYEDAQGNTVTVPAATVVSAFGYKAYNPLEEIALS